MVVWHGMRHLHHSHDAVVSLVGDRSTPKRNEFSPKFINLFAFVASDMLLEIPLEEREIVQVVG